MPQSCWNHKEQAQGLAQTKWELRSEWLPSSPQQGLGRAGMGILGSNTSLGGSEGWAPAGHGALAPFALPQESWTPTGPARRPSAWGAAGGGTRSSSGASVGTAAAAGWATSPSAEVKPRGDPWGRRRALCHTQECQCLPQPGPLGDTARGTHSPVGVSPGAAQAARPAPIRVRSELRAARGGRELGGARQ